MTSTGLRPGSRTPRAADHGEPRAQAGRRRTDTPAADQAEAGRTGRRRGREPMHARFAQRARALRRRARRVWTWLAVVLLLVGALVVTLWWSPAFVVSQVTVSGARGDLAQGVQQRAGIPDGIPLARVETDAVAVRVEQDLRIAEATVSRDWPSAVDIRVRLRQPALVVEQSGSARLQVADASGVIFDEVATQPADLMQVTAPRGDLGSEPLAGVLSLRKALPPETVRQISSVRLSVNGGLSFALGSVQVDWGVPGQERLKAQVLDALLAQQQIDPEGEQDTAVDLSAPQTPVVTGLTPDEDD